MPPARAKEPPEEVAKRVEARVRERISPSPEELAKVARVRADLVRAVQQAAQERHSPLVRALVAGSAARGTFLKDRLDIDFFLLFPPDLPRARLEEEGLALGTAVLDRPQRKYAEHPYLRGTFQGFTVDTVPGYAVSDPAQPLSAVDRTPFHDDYLRQRQTPAIVAEVRLAKRFLNALGVYGSEARTEGFSGYLTELLLLEFGTLHGWLKAARSWRLPVRLCPEGREPPRLPADVALILPDAVDPNRNVASALSRRNLALFILASGAYLERPSEGWFEPRPPPRLPKGAALDRFHARGSHAVAIELPRPELVDDNLYPQLRKAERMIVEEIGRAGFSVLGSASVVAPELLYVLVEVGAARRPAVKAQDGPPAGIDRVDQFLEKWTAPGAPVLQGPYLREDGTLGIDVRQPEVAVERVLVGALPRIALGKDLGAVARDRSRILQLVELPPIREVEEGLSELLDKQLPWLRRTIATGGPAAR